VRGRPPARLDRDRSRRRASRPVFTHRFTIAARVASGRSGFCPPPLAERGQLDRRSEQLPDQGIAWPMHALTSTTLVLARVGWLNVSNLPRQPGRAVRQPKSR